MERSWLAPIGRNLLVAVVYFAGAELGLSLAALHSNVTPVWPPTGIAIASLLIFGRQVWPGIFIGALVANLLTNIPVFSSFGIAIGNTLEALVAYWLLRNSKRWKGSLESVSSVLTFVVYAAVLAPLVSATIGSVSLCLGEPSQWDRFASLWLTWWMGDGFGALIISPFLLAWSSPRKIESRDMPEITALFVSLIIVVLIVFGGWFPGPVKTYPLAFLSLPSLLWTAMKFHQRVVTSAIVLMAGVAVWGAKQGYGPFVPQCECIAVAFDLVRRYELADDLNRCCGNQRTKGCGSSEIETRLGAGASPPPRRRHRRTRTRRGLGSLGKT